MIRPPSGRCCLPCWDISTSGCGSRQWPTVSSGAGSGARTRTLTKPFSDIRRRAPAGSPVMAALAEAEQRHAEAVTALGAKKYSDALAAVEGAEKSLLAAYCAAQTPQQGEHRAWWCHSAFGVSGMTWDEAIKNLADNGFTAILPNMLWGGVAFYESNVLPVAPSVREKGDQIAQCVAACKKYGLECHVWKVNWNMGHESSAEFVEQMRSAGRTQVTYSGKPEPRWLCPSHPANQQLEIDSMTEVAAKYPVDGIHFDYIRYPGSDNCFCPGCRERFEAAAGNKIANWPADTRNEPVVRQKWLDFRRGNITRVVAAVHEAARKQRPRREDFGGRVSKLARRSRRRRTGLEAVV